MEWPTPKQLAHNDQVLADINARLDVMVATHRAALADGDIHRQVLIAGFGDYILEHSDASSLAQFLAVAIDRLAFLEKA
jgi:hypothetical protein